jgi:hypothetical protein
VDATEENPMPGVVHIHGYQNNRETGDAYCIELARRGFVVLNIDAIGRGNSGMPNDPKDPKFDKTILLALILFGFAYFSEYLFEQIFIVDFRFLFPFASDLTVERAWMCLRYFPFILVGFVFMGIFLHGQLRRSARHSRLAT